MAPVSSAEGLKTNWVNYKTGVKDVRFYMEADGHNAGIGIKLLHSDLDIRQSFFEKFVKLKPFLEQHVQEPWIWDAQHTDAYGKVTALIYTQLQSVNVYNPEHWPSLISFLKPRLIALDAFWSEWKPSFEDTEL